MRTWILGIALAQACTLAAAQGSGAAASASGPAAGSASYRCGGIGVDEQKAIKAEAARHGLLLSFARPGGAYIADVDVEIGNGRGTVVRAHCGGPLMLVDLAGSGTWEVTARAQGQTQRKSVTLTGKPATLAFTWPG